MLWQRLAVLCLAPCLCSAGVLQSLSSLRTSLQENSMSGGGATGGGSSSDNGAGATGKKSPLKLQPWLTTIDANAVCADGSPGGKPTILLHSV